MMVKKKWKWFIGDITEQYLRKFDYASGTDKTFGLRDKMVSFTLGTRKQNKGKQYKCS